MKAMTFLAVPAIVSLLPSTGFAQPFGSSTRSTETIAAIKAVDTEFGEGLPGVSIRIGPYRGVTGASGEAEVTLPRPAAGAVVYFTYFASKDGFAFDSGVVRIDSQTEFVAVGPLRLPPKSPLSSFFAEDTDNTFLATIPVAGTAFGSIVGASVELEIPAGTFDEPFGVRVIPRPTWAHVRPIGSRWGAPVIEQIHLEFVDRTGHEIRANSNRLIVVRVGSWNQFDFPWYEEHGAAFSIWGFDPALSSWASVTSDVTLLDDGRLQFELAGVPPLISVFSGDWSATQPIIGNPSGGPHELTRTQVVPERVSEEPVRGFGPLAKFDISVTYERVIAASTQVTCGSRAGSTEVEMTAGQIIAGSEQVVNELKEELSGEVEVTAGGITASLAGTVGSSVTQTGTSSNTLSQSQTQKGGAPAGDDPGMSGKSGIMIVWQYRAVYEFRRNGKVVGKLVVPLFYHTDTSGVTDDANCRQSQHTGH